MTLRQAAGFGVLCLWSSVGWLTVDLLPARLAPIAGQGLHFLLIGVAAIVFHFFRRRPGGVPQVRVCWAVTGVGLFGVTLLLLDVAQGMSSPTLGVVVFGLVPVVVLAAAGKMTLLLPALAGVAGILLLVPVGLPASGRSWEGLGLVVLAGLLTAGCLVALHRCLREVETAWAVAVVCVATGVLLGCAGLWVGSAGWGWTAVGVEAVRALLLDMPEVVLLIWLVKAAEPYRVAARYLVVPLFTVIEGFVMLRPGIDGRTVAGVTLLAAGSWWLLRGDAGESVGLGLR